MIIALYLLTLLFLGIYSYSQIDLNLTLFQNPQFLTFQNAMIQLGYFHRPQSTVIFLSVLLVLSLLYVLLIKNAEKLTKKNLVILASGFIILALFAYPAFSHDIFNYIFDARIFAYHHQNPYTHTALMFPHDDWTRFMNWTHRPYPYGPTFLPITIFFYMLGFGKFVLTLISFKLMTLLAFLGSCYLIKKLAGIRGLVFFAANPLIIFEVVISNHLDILMLFFALLGWFLLMAKKKFSPYLSLLVSIGIKYATVLLLPAFILKNLKLAIILAFIGSFVQIFFREALPSYFVVPLGFVALMPENKKLIYVTAALSIAFLVIRYYGFISTGSWPKALF